MSLKQNFDTVSNPIDVQFGCFDLDKKSRNKNDDTLQTPAAFQGEIQIKGKRDLELFVDSIVKNEKKPLVLCLKFKDAQMTDTVTKNICLQTTYAMCPPSLYKAGMNELQSSKMAINCQVPVQKQGLEARDRSRAGKENYITFNKQSTDSNKSKSVNKCSLFKDQLQNLFIFPCQRKICSDPGQPNRDNVNQVVDSAQVYKEKYGTTKMKNGKEKQKLKPNAERKKSAVGDENTKYKLDDEYDKQKLKGGKSRKHTPPFAAELHFKQSGKEIGELEFDGKRYGAALRTNENTDMCSHKQPKGKNDKPHKWILKEAEGDEGYKKRHGINPEKDITSVCRCKYFMPDRECKCEYVLKQLGIKKIGPKYELREPEDPIHKFTHKVTQPSPAHQKQSFSSSRSAVENGSPQLKNPHSEKQRTSVSLYNSDSRQQAEKPLQTLKDSEKRNSIPTKFYRPGAARHQYEESDSENEESQRELRKDSKYRSCLCGTCRGTRKLSDSSCLGRDSCDFVSKGLTKCLKGLYSFGAPCGARDSKSAQSSRGSCVKQCCKRDYKGMSKTQNSSRDGCGKGDIKNRKYESSRSVKKYKESQDNPRTKLGENMIIFQKPRKPNENQFNQKIEPGEYLYCGCTGYVIKYNEDDALQPQEKSVSPPLPRKPLSPPSRSSLTRKPLSQRPKPPLPDPISPPPSPKDQSLAPPSAPAPPPPPTPSSVEEKPPETVPVKSSDKKLPEKAKKKPPRPKEPRKKKKVKQGPEESQWKPPEKTKIRRKPDPSTFVEPPQQYPPGSPIPGFSFKLDSCTLELDKKKVPIDKDCLIKRQERQRFTQASRIMQQPPTLIMNDPYSTPLRIYEVSATEKKRYISGKSRVKPRPPPLSEEVEREKLLRTYSEGKIPDEKLVMVSKLSKDSKLPVDAKGKKDAKKAKLVKSVTEVQGEGDKTESKAKKQKVFQIKKKPVVLPGAILLPGGLLLLPEGTKLPEGSVLPDGSLLPGGKILPEGKVLLLEGSLLPEGTILPEGVITPEAKERIKPGKISPGGKIYVTEEVTLSNGTTIPVGMILTASKKLDNGNVSVADEVILADGKKIPAGTEIPGNKVESAEIILLREITVLPDGTILNVGTIIPNSIVDDNCMVIPSEPLTISGGRVIPAGTELPVERVVTGGRLIIPEDILLPNNTKLQTGRILEDGKILLPPGTLVPEGTELPDGTKLPGFEVLPGGRVLRTEMKGVPPALYPLLRTPSQLSDIPDDEKCKNVRPLPKKPSKKDKEVPKEVKPEVVEKRSCLRE